MTNMFLAMSLLLWAPGESIAQNSLEFKKLGIIREFGGTDNAALFGVRFDSGTFNVTEVIGPGFLKTYQVGTLTQSSVGNLFVNSSKPLGPTEKLELLTNFGGATLIYTEGYSGQLCTSDEIMYEVVATGSVNETNVEVAFQFVAEPSAQDNCKFQIFGVEVRY